MVTRLERGKCKPLKRQWRDQHVTRYQKLATRHLRPSNGVHSVIVQLSRAHGGIGVLGLHHAARQLGKGPSKNIIQLYSKRPVMVCRKIASNNQKPSNVRHHAHVPQSRAHGTIGESGPPLVAVLLGSGRLMNSTRQCSKIPVTVYHNIVSNNQKRKLERQCARVPQSCARGTTGVIGLPRVAGLPDRGPSERISPLFSKPHVTVCP